MIKFYKLVICLINVLNIKTSKILFMDRINKANDNAEVLYDTLDGKKKSYFIISKKSSDYTRLKAKGFKMIKYGSFSYYINLYTSSALISSHADNNIVDPLNNGKFKIKRKYKFIFLQHGIINSDLSEWLNPKKIDLMITSTKAEYDLVASTIKTQKIVLTGMPRYDRLYPKEELYHVIFPTWRSNIKTKEQLINSTYFKTWITFMEKMDERAIFIVHNKMSKFIDVYIEFVTNSNVEVVSDKDIEYNNICCHAKSFITDYSSFFNDFIYLNKPVFFNLEELSTVHLSNKGRNLNVYDEVGYTFTNYREYQSLKEQRKDNSSYFMYNDHNNSERVIAEIKEIISKE